MDCNDFEKLAGRVLDGEAAPEEATALEAHAASCESCGVLIGDLSALGRLHSGLPELEPPAGLTDRIMAGIKRFETGWTGWIWRVLVPAAAAVFVLLGIRIGTQITDAWFGEPAVVQHSEVTGLEHLDVYPPDSFGKAIELAAKGEDDE